MSKRFLGGSTAGKDLYQLLQIPHGSQLSEIKVAYKKLALRLHPDRNQGDAAKTKQFKDISEAYSILSNDLARRQYDLQHGHRYNKNRRTAPPKNYRKVYAPVPPAHVKRTFDHTRHYEMHYGQGMMDDAVHQATREAKRNGLDTSYQSPLGKGFEFQTSGGINETTNPYARGTRRRTTSTVWEYEEGTLFDGDSAQGNVKKRAHVTVDVDGHRSVRKAKEEAQRRKEEAANNSAFAPQEDACVIQ